MGGSEIPNRLTITGTGTFSFPRPFRSMSPLTKEEARAAFAKLPIVVHSIIPWTIFSGDPDSYDYTGCDQCWGLFLPDEPVWHDGDYFPAYFPMHRLIDDPNAIFNSRIETEFFKPEEFDPLIVERSHLLSNSTFMAIISEIFQEMKRARNSHMDMDAHRFRHRMLGVMCWHLAFRGFQIDELTRWIVHCQINALWKSMMLLG